MGSEQFAVLILIGRPASGKSEIGSHLISLPEVELRRRFHLNRLEVIDDFPLLWAWFEEDDIRADLGIQRVHSDEERRFLDERQWHVLLRRLGLEHGKRLRDAPEYHNNRTLLVEFARGAEHGGYRLAFQHLPDEMLKEAAVLYVKVSLAESLRKNRLRFNPERPDSILEHALTDERLRELYGSDDWDQFVAADPEYLAVGESRIPYVVFENEDDVTTGQPELLSERLEARLDKLWRLWRNNA